jgi:urate oxidase
MSEWSVNISLVSDVEDAFTSGDNSGIVATDTCKNTVSTNLAVGNAAALGSQIPKRVWNVRAYECLFGPRSRSQMS